MARARPLCPDTEQEVAPARPGRGLRRARLLRGAWRVRLGREAAGARAPASGQRVLMAAPAPGEPGAAASAVLDELARNFTYGAQGAGNGSLSGAWYRRNQVRSGRPAARGGDRVGAALRPTVPRTPGCPRGQS